MRNFQDTFKGHEQYFFNLHDCTFKSLFTLYDAANSTKNQKSSEDQFFIKLKKSQLGPILAFWPDSLPLKNHLSQFKLYILDGMSTIKYLFWSANDSIAK